MIIPWFIALTPDPSAYIPICEASFTLIIPVVVSLRILAVLVYIPTAPVFPVPKVIVPVLVPVLVLLPLIYIPTPEVPILNAPDDETFISSVYIAVPLSKAKAFTATPIFLVSPPVPL